MQAIRTSAIALPHRAIRSYRDKRDVAQRYTREGLFCGFRGHGGKLKRAVVVKGNERHERVRESDKTGE
jgi:hypothetical protein